MFGLTLGFRVIQLDRSFSNTVDYFVGRIATSVVPSSLLSCERTDVEIRASLRVVKREESLLQRLDGLQ